VDKVRVIAVAIDLSDVTRARDKRRWAAIRPRETRCSRRCTGAFRAEPQRTGGTRKAARCQRRTDRAQAAVPTHARHVSERALLYGLVKAHYPDLMARLTAQDRSLPESGVDRASAPTFAQLTLLADKIAHRVCRHLERNGWLEGEDESVFLSDRAGCDDGLDALRMSSITYRIATGAQAGRVVTTLQTIPADTDAPEGDAGKVGGFSLHAGVAAEAHEGQKLERLCRYIARPAISEKRLSLSPQGKVRYQLKTPWKNGTTHVEFEPVEFIAKLAALVPPPRAHLIRFHGVFTPGIVAFALRATLRLFKFAPGEFVRQTRSCARS